MNEFWCFCTYRIFVHKAFYKLRKRCGGNIIPSLENSVTSVCARVPKCESKAELLLSIFTFDAMQSRFKQRWFFETSIVGELHFFSRRTYSLDNYDLLNQTRMAGDLILSRGPVPPLRSDTLSTMMSVCTNDCTTFYDFLTSRNTVFFC